MSQKKYVKSAPSFGPPLTHCSFFPVENSCDVDVRLGWGWLGPKQPPPPCVVCTLPALLSATKCPFPQRDTECCGAHSATEDCISLRATECRVLDAKDGCASRRAADCWALQPCVNTSLTCMSCFCNSRNGFQVWTQPQMMRWFTAPRGFPSLLRLLAGTSCLHRHEVFHHCSARRAKLEAYTPQCALGHCNACLCGFRCHGGGPLGTTPGIRAAAPPLVGLLPIFGPCPVDHLQIPHPQPPPPLAHGRCMLQCGSA